MSSVTRELVESAIKQYIDPSLQQDLVSAKCIKNVAIDGDKVTVDVVLGFPANSEYQGELASHVKELVTGMDGVADATVNVSSKIEPHTAQKGVKPIQGVKNIIAIASGKGGVGKSTTAVNLALALQAEGATVGILDADIYGPSQPRMLGVSDKPESKDGKTLQPLVGHGIQYM